MVHPYRDVDVCVTIIHHKAPRLPLREELLSLGAETIYTNRGRGTVNLAAKHIRAEKIRKYEQRQIAEHRREHINNNQDTRQQLSKKIGNDIDCKHRSIKKSENDVDCNDLQKIPSVEKCHKLKSVTFDDLDGELCQSKSVDISYDEKQNTGIKSRNSFKEIVVEDTNITEIQSNSFEVNKAETKYIKGKRFGIEDNQFKKADIVAVNVRECNIEDDEAQETEFDDTKTQRTKGQHSKVDDFESEVEYAEDNESEAEMEYTEDDESEAEMKYTKVDEPETETEYSEVNEFEAEVEYIDADEAEVEYTKVNENEAKLKFTKSNEYEGKVEYTEVNKTEVECAEIKETEVESTKVVNTKVESAKVEDDGIEYNIVRRNEMAEDYVSGRSLEIEFQETEMMDPMIQKTKFGNATGRKAQTKETHLQNYNNSTDDYTEAVRSIQFARDRMAARKTAEQVAHNRMAARKTAEAFVRKKETNSYLHEASECKSWEKEIQEARTEVRRLQWSEYRSSELDRARTDVANQRQKKNDKVSRTQTAIDTVRQRSLLRAVNSLSDYQQVVRQPKEEVVCGNKVASFRDATEKDMFAINWDEELVKAQRSRPNEWVQRYTVQESNNGELHSKWVSKAMQQGNHFFERSKSEGKAVE